MLLSQPVNSVPAAHARAKMLNYLAPRNSFGYVTNYWQSLAGAAENSLDIPEATTRPRASFWYKDGRLYLFISGVTTEAQVQAIRNAYQFIPLFIPLLPFDPVNQWFKDAAADIWTRIRAHIPGRWDLTIAGHSAGGAIAYYVGQKYREMFTVNPSIITFGSPRAGGDNAYIGVNERNSCRWMNDDDPVPLVPTRLRRNEMNWEPQLPSVGNRINHYQHPEGGVRISGTGVLTPAFLPTDIPDPENLALRRWAEVLRAGGQSAHSIAVYEARLWLALPPAEQPPLAAPPPVQRAPTLTPVAAREPVLNIPVREFRQGEVQAVQTLFTDSSRQNAIPLHIPNQRLFKARRSGRVWYVDFGTRTVAVGPTKKKARGLANVGNELLRRLGRMGRVISSDLIDQVVEYLFLAADPASGITPTIRT